MEDWDLLCFLSASSEPIRFENIGFADIVRGSDEDFENIFRAGNSKKAYETFKDKCDCLIYTASEKGVFIHTLNVEYSYPVLTLKPISESLSLRQTLTCLYIW